MKKRVEIEIRATPAVREFLSLEQIQEFVQITATDLPHLRPGKSVERGGYGLRPAAHVCNRLSGRGPVQGPSRAGEGNRVCGGQVMLPRVSLHIDLKVLDDGQGPIVVGQQEGPEQDHAGHAERLGPRSHPVPAADVEALIAQSTAYKVD